jgi:Flp pilus assembly protein TadG
MQTSAAKPNRLPTSRSGVAVLWMIALTLVFVACMQFVLEAGWMLICRSQAQAVAESAALGGAREWGLATVDNAAARTAAKARATALVVNSQVSGLTSAYGNLQTALQNSNNTTGINNNPAGCPGTLVSSNQVILGDINSTTRVFSPGVSPASAGRRGCMVQFQLVAVSPITSASRTFSARATAFWDSAATPNRSRLLSVTISCP